MNHRGQALGSVRSARSGGPDSHDDESESSQIVYAYDEATSTNGAGNLTSKTQQRGPSGSAVSTTVRYHYDALNRMTAKAYAGTPDAVVTPAVNYTYDVHEAAIAGSYPKGRRTRAEAVGVSVTLLESFDAVGRVTRSKQVTGTTPYRFGTDPLAGYEYLLNGELAKLRMPSGRELTYQHDEAGRPVGLSDGTKTYGL